jgi:hypothetical protein
LNSINRKADDQAKQHDNPISSYIVSNVKLTPLIIKETQLAIEKALPIIATIPHKSKKTNFSSKESSSHGV